MSSSINSSVNSPVNSLESWNVPNAKLGVGAVVIRDEKVLLVQINYGPAKGLWILPGGRVENSEVLHEALLREVFEETNLKVTFDGVLAFRQRVLENGNFDIYFICHCKLVPEAYSAEPTIPDTDELLAVKFWPVAEALSSDNIRPFTKEAIQMARSNKPTFGTLPKLPLPPGDHAFG
jgi:ADP-ribose pyrophosphatase YjhB (NUDIX family)